MIRRKGFNIAVPLSVKGSLIWTSIARMLRGRSFGRTSLRCGKGRTTKEVDGRTDGY
jgi:hypothetical protein